MGDGQGRVRLQRLSGARARRAELAFPQSFIGVSAGASAPAPKRISLSKSWKHLEDGCKKAKRSLWAQPLWAQMRRRPKRRAPTPWTAAHAGHSSEPRETAWGGVHEEREGRAD